MSIYKTRIEQMKELLAKEGIDFYLVPTAFAKRSISRTLKAGFAMVSPKTAFVLGLNAAASSSSVQSGATKVKSMPIFFMVTEKRLNVPP